MWLSSNPDFEVSALKSTIENGQSRLLTLEEMHAGGQGVFRFVIDSRCCELEILPWQILKARSKMSKKFRTRLVDRAKSAGAQPKQWYGTLVTIPVTGLLLEQYTDEGWLPCDPSTLSIDNRYVVQGTVRELGITMTNEHWKIDK